MKLQDLEMFYPVLGGVSIAFVLTFILILLDAWWSK